MTQGATEYVSRRKAPRFHGGKVHIGPRGGQYLNRHQRKVYLGNKAYHTKKVKQAEAPAKYRL